MNWCDDDFSSQDRDMIYLDAAGKSPLPKIVAATGYEALQTKCKPWIESIDSAQDEGRRLFAKLIGASSDCIAYAPSTCFAMTLVAKNILNEGNLNSAKTILIESNEMASNVYPWQYLSSMTGATLVTVPSPSPSDTQAWHERIISLLDENIGLIAISNVHWCNGSVIDLQIISDKIQTMSNIPYFVVDGTQSIGALAIDVTKLNVDFVACSVHKWLLAPYGTSLMYLHPRHHSTWIPLDLHERSRRGSDNPYWDAFGPMGHDRESGVGYPQTFMEGAIRINAGGRCNPILTPMLVASLKLILKWNVDSIQQYLIALTDILADIITNRPGCRGFSVLPKHLRCGHILGVFVDSIYLQMSPTDVVTFLHNHGVKAVVRQGVIRLSPHVYNTQSQMETVGNLLEHLSTGVSHSPIKTKVLIMGGNGWLAQHLTKSLCTGPLSIFADIHLTYRGKSSPVWMPTDNCHYLDLSAPFDAHNVIANLLPDVIIHTAAVTSPAVCENSVDEAYAVNNPHAIIDAIHRYVPKCIVIYTSTDLIYDGDTYSLLAPISPYDLKCSPKNVYGRSKLDFEKEIYQLTYGVVLRLSNMIGASHPYIGGKQLFLQWLYKCLEKNEYISLKTDEYRSFVAVDDVVHVITSIIQLAVDRTRNFNASTADRSLYHTNITYDHSCFTQKVYNVGGPQALSRLDLAKIVCECLNISLLIDNENVYENTSSVEHIDNRKVWKVGTCCSKDIVQQFKTGTLVSPLYVAMDSSLTEDHFGIRFNSMCDTVKQAFNSIV